jgi:hypothetical protein
MKQEVLKINSSSHFEKSDIFYFLNKKIRVKNKKIN